MTVRPLLVVLALLLAGAALAPFARAEVPTTTPASAEVDRLLDALDRGGRDLKNLTAVVVLTELDLTMGDAPVRWGKIALQRDADGKTTFLVSFAGVQTNVGEPGADEKPMIRDERIDYLLRGDELVDRNYRIKSEVVRKLPPEQAGRDLLKLGEGPFPLPIGQPREEVRREFDVRAVDPANEAENQLQEPATPGAKRLRLTPKPSSPLAEDFQWVEIDVVPETGLPAKVITLNKAGTEARITRLRNLKINADLPPGSLELEPIDKAEWNVKYEDMTQPARP